MRTDAHAYIEGIIQEATRLGQIDPATTPNFRLTVALRKQLEEQGLNERQASMLALLTRIEVGEILFTDDQVERLAAEAAKVQMAALTTFWRALPGLSMDEVAAAIGPKLYIHLG